MFVADTDSVNPGSLSSQVSDDLPARALSPLAPSAIPPLALYGTPDLNSSSFLPLGRSGYDNTAASDRGYHGCDTWIESSMYQPQPDISRRDPSTNQGSMTYLELEPLISGRPSHSRIASSPILAPPTSGGQVPGTTPARRRARRTKPVDEAVQKLPPRKQSKHHPCPMCSKSFPRPSGLLTHMNGTHNNIKPFRCPIEECGKAFSVQSNATRHLRTHREAALPYLAKRPAFTSDDYPEGVDFEDPIVHHTPSPPPDQEDCESRSRKERPLRWMSPSLVRFSNTSSLRSTYCGGSRARTAHPLEDGDGSKLSAVPSIDYDSDCSSDDSSLLSLPLAPVCPNSNEERNSYSTAHAYPYHPMNYTGVLPGPALHSY